MWTITNIVFIFMYYLLCCTQRLLFPFQFSLWSLQFLHPPYSPWLNSLQPIFIDYLFCSSLYSQNTTLNKTQHLPFRNVRTGGDLKNWAVRTQCHEMPALGKVGCHWDMWKGNQRRWCMNQGNILFLPTHFHPADLEGDHSDVIPLWNFKKSLISLWTLT